NAPYSLVITIDDTLSWLCDNYANYSVTIGGQSDVSGTTATACGNLVIDTFAIGACPDCFAPVALAADNFTSSSVDFSWTGSGTLFELEWGPSGFTQGTGTTVSGAVSPYALSGLTSATSYQFYVREDCGTDGFSVWAGPFDFTTECDTFLLPFQEEFSTSV